MLLKYRSYPAQAESFLFLFFHMIKLAKTQGRFEGVSIFNFFCISQVPSSDFTTTIISALPPVILRPDLKYKMFLSFFFNNLNITIIYKDLDCFAIHVYLNYTNIHTITDYKQ